MNVMFDNYSRSRFFSFVHSFVTVFFLCLFYWHRVSEINSRSSHSHLYSKCNPGAAVVCCYRFVSFFVEQKIFEIRNEAYTERAFFFGLINFDHSHILSSIDIQIHQKSSRFFFFTVNEWMNGTNHPPIHWMMIMNRPTNQKKKIVKWNKIRPHFQSSNITILPPQTHTKSERRGGGFEFE